MNTYLVRANQFLVFVERDPRLGGCPFPIEPGVRLDRTGFRTARGDHAPPDLCVGIDPEDDRHYRLFRSGPRRARSGFRQVVGMPVVVPTWGDFVDAVEGWEDCVA